MSQWTVWDPGAGSTSELDGQAQAYARISGRLRDGSSHIQAALAAAGSMKSLAIDAWRKRATKAQTDLTAASQWLDGLAQAFSDYSNAIRSIDRRAKAARDSLPGVARSIVMMATQTSGAFMGGIFGYAMGLVEQQLAAAADAAGLGGLREAVEGGVRTLSNLATERKTADATFSARCNALGASESWFVAPSTFSWGEYNAKGTEAKIVDLAFGDGPYDGKMHTAVGLATFGSVAGTIGADGEVSGSFGDPDGVHGKGSASYWAGVHGEGSAGASFEDGQLKASASGTVGVGVHGEAEGTIQSGPWEASGKVEGTAGAWASADAGVSIGKEGVKAEAGVEAFAGASGSVKGSVGITGAQVGATVTGYAGIGVKADAKVQATPDGVKISCEFGAAFGIGAGVKFDIDISPKKIVNAITSWWPF